MGIHGLWEVSNLLRTPYCTVRSLPVPRLIFFLGNSFFQITPNLSIHFPQLQSIQSRTMAPTICRSLRDFASVSMQGMCNLYFCPQPASFFSFFCVLSPYFLFQHLVEPVPPGVRKSSGACRSACPSSYHILPPWPACRPSGYPCLRIRRSSATCTKKRRCYFRA